MALHKTTAYYAACDSCKELYINGSDFSIFKDIDFLKEELPDSEWANEKGKLLCPNCTTTYEEVDSINDLVESRGVTVNFNSIRRKLQNSYNGVVNTLNDAIDSEELDEFVGESLEGNLSMLHNLIVALMCSFQEDDESMKDLSDEVDLKIFNPYKYEDNEDS